MEFPNFTYPEGTPSYPSHEVVWNYMNSYATHFNLTNHIKYHHLVEKVRSKPKNKWEVIVKDLPNNQSITNIYDGVFVCTGICSSPRIPKIKNINKFKGRILHSREYRKPNPFEGVFDNEY